jgi:hypothetical protein
LRHFFALCFWTLVLCGCQSSVPAPAVLVARPAVILPEISDTCGTADLDWLIGENYARLSEAALLGELRILRPGDKVDGYISPSRINAQLDSKGRVRRLFCG